MVVLGWNGCIFTFGGRNLLKLNFSVNEEETRPIVSHRSRGYTMGLRVVRILDRRTY